MTIMKTVADTFRTAPKNESIDRYNILSPLMATGDYASAMTSMITIFKDGPIAGYIKGTVKAPNVHVQKAIEAYKDYVKALPSHEQTLEKAVPFCTVLLALESISGNITQIEDNFQPLFGNLTGDKPEENLRSSSLVIIGYLEKADMFSTWLSGIVEHITADDNDMIPPFRTKELIDKARDMADFAMFNLHKWNYKHEALLGEVKVMQAKGSDLAVQAPNGTWIDEFAHDNQFSPMEQNLIMASMRSPIMWLITRGIVKTQDKINLYTTRKDWLTSKIVLEQSKLRGMDPESVEYRRMKKATDKYADLVSHLEQKIERMRG